MQIKARAAELGLDIDFRGAIDHLSPDVHGYKVSIRTPEMHCAPARGSMLATGYPDMSARHSPGACQRQPERCGGHNDSRGPGNGQVGPWWVAFCVRAAVCTSSICCVTGSQCIPMPRKFRRKHHEAVALVCAVARHPENAFFEQFKNCLIYDDGDDFVRCEHLDGKCLTHKAAMVFAQVDHRVPTNNTMPIISAVVTSPNDSVCRRVIQAVEACHRE